MIHPIQNKYNRRWLRHGVAAALMLSIAACNGQRDKSAVQVDVIGEPDQMARPLQNSMSAAGKLILGATAQGLLSFDANGEVVGAMAESWIVEDGGQSFIFRLKRLNWPGGEPVKAEQVARLLRERMRANPLSLAGLEPDVRAMTDRVIEIRLDVSLPAFLQLLAQPQLAILPRGGGTGPYEGVDDKGAADLIPVVPPLAPSLEVDEEEQVTPQIDHRHLRAMRASLALVRFKAGESDLVLGGRFQHLPLTKVVGLTQNEVEFDPAPGLFGLGFTSKSKFLDDLAVRDALARVVDRAQIGAALSLPTWATRVYPMPGPLELERQPSAPAWTGEPIAERIVSARGIIERWVAANGEPPMLRIALPEGPGASLLFRRLARDFGQIGVSVDRVAMDEAADLRLIDEIAPFDSAFWYLSRLDCAGGLRCDSRVAPLLEQARKQQDRDEQARLLGEAEEATVAYAGFIPLGQPIRWAAVGRRLTGFQPSPRGVHPLNRLIITPR